MARRSKSTRADKALELIEAQPGITAKQIGEKMKLKVNYLYNILGDLEKEGKVGKEGRRYYPQLSLARREYEDSSRPPGSRRLDRSGNGHPASGKVKSIKLHETDLETLDLIRAMDKKTWPKHRANLNPNDRWHQEWKAPTDSEIIRRLLRDLRTTIETKKSRSGSSPKKKKVAK